MRVAGTCLTFDEDTSIGYLAVAVARGTYTAWCMEHDVVVVYHPHESRTCGGLTFDGGLGTRSQTKRMTYD